MTGQFRLRRVEDDYTEQDIHGFVRDAINPFAKKAEVTIEDDDGDQVTEWPRYTLVEIDVRVPGFFDWTRRFAGFVQDRHTDRDDLELTILSHDYWLRKKTIYAEYEDEPLSAILEDLVDRETPLEWDPDRIELENDETISRRWAGEPLEAVLDEIRSISGGDELYGATFDREFYFEPLDDDSAPRRFTEGEYYDIEWDEDGKREINRAVVRYGEGEEQSVVIENDRTAQRELADQIGSDSPVEVEVQRNLPEIGSEDRARSKARQLLERGVVVESGVIETWEGYAVLPGQLTEVVDADQELDDEFRVTQIEYEFPGGDPETEVIVADRSLDTVDELVELSDEVQRQDLRDADPDAPVLEAIVEEVGVEFDVQGQLTARVFGEERFRPGFRRDVTEAEGYGSNYGSHYAGLEITDESDTLGFGRNVPGFHVDEVRQAPVTRSRVTNGLLNAVRDAWRDEAPTPPSDVALGSGDSRPSRSDTDLDDEVGQQSATITRIGDDTVRWATTIRFTESQTVRELGVTNGDLWSRTLLEDDVEVPADAPIDAEVRVQALEDDDYLGDLETAGAQFIRDTLADADPDPPADLRFVATDGEEIDIEIEAFRTRGAGQIEARARLTESDAGGASIEAIATVTDDGVTLVTNEFAQIDVVGIDLEATQHLRLDNA